MKIASKEEIRMIDRLALRDYRIPSLILMENAGQAVFEVIKSVVSNYEEKKFVVFCGTGNNGGDGAVVARKLFVNNIYVQLILLGDREKTSGVNKRNFDIAEKMGIPFFSVRDEKDWDALKRLMIRFDVAVDALLGLGFKGELSLLFSSVIHTINSFKEIIAVDLPSGVYANGGNAQNAVKATHTVTFGLPKTGTVDYPVLNFLGTLHVDHIGLPRELLKNQSLKNHLLDQDNIKRMLPERKRNSHKGDYGHLAIVSAQQGMLGASRLVGLAAFRAGAGLVTVTGNKDAALSLSMSAPALMAFLLEDEGFYSLEAFFSRRKISTIAVGSGWGIKEENETFLKHLFASQHIQNMVLDADALNLISNSKSLSGDLKSTKKEIILTPHVKEMARLMRRNLSFIKQFKADVARDFAAEYGLTVVLKDAVTVIATTDGELWYDQSGSEVLAKGGSGDILSGLIAGMWVSGASAKAAALCGSSYLLGKTGEAYAKRFGTRSAFPDDLIALIPEVFADLEKD